MLLERTLVDRDGDMSLFLSDVVVISLSPLVNVKGLEAPSLRSGAMKVLISVGGRQIGDKRKPAKTNLSLLIGRELSPDLTSWILERELKLFLGASFSVSSKKIEEIIFPNFSKIELFVVSSIFPCSQIDLLGGRILGFHFSVGHIQDLGCHVDDEVFHVWWYSEIEDHVLIVFESQVFESLCDLGCIDEVLDLDSDLRVLQKCD